MSIDLPKSFNLLQLRIAILSRNPNLYSTQSLRNACIRRGHDVTVIDHMQCNLIMEQGFPAVSYHRRLLDYFDAIIPRIGSSVTYYGAAVVRQFEMMDVVTPVESNALLRSRDKLRSLQQMSRAGLGLPRTVFTNFSKEAEEIVQLAGGPPLIVKLLEGTQGLGVILAETRSAATSVIEAFHKLEARVIVQEYIEEAKGSDIRVIVVGGEIVAAMKRTAKSGEFRSNLHRGGTSKIVGLTDLEKKSSIRAAEAVGIDVAGVDLLQSKRGPLIMEVNASPGLEGIESTTGIDIAGKIVTFVEGKFYAQKKNREDGKSAEKQKNRYKRKFDKDRH